jgi:hypothetical protein
MGPNYPLSFYDEEALSAIEAAFRKVWQTVALSDPFRDTRKDDMLRITILEQLMSLVKAGVRNPEELRAQTLRQLPLS